MRKRLSLIFNSSSDTPRDRGSIPLVPLGAEGSGPGEAVYLDKPMDFHGPREGAPAVDSKVPAHSGPRPRAPTLPVAASIIDGGSPNGHVRRVSSEVPSQHSGSLGEAMLDNTTSRNVRAYFDRVGARSGSHRRAQEERGSDASAVDAAGGPHENHLLILHPPTTDDTVFSDSNAFDASFSTDGPQLSSAPTTTVTPYVNAWMRAFKNIAFAFAASLTLLLIAFIVTLTKDYPDWVSSRLIGVYEPPPKNRTGVAGPISTGSSSASISDLNNLKHHVHQRYYPSPCQGFLHDPSLSPLLFYSGLVLCLVFLFIWYVVKAISLEKFSLLFLSVCTSYLIIGLQAYLFFGPVASYLTGPESSPAAGRNDTGDGGAGQWTTNGANSGWPSTALAFCRVALLLVALAASVALPFLGWRVYQAFGWRMYVKGATLREDVMKLAWYQLLDLLLRTDLILCFVTAAALMLLGDDVPFVTGAETTEVLTSTYWLRTPTAVTSIITGILFFCSSRFIVRRENVQLLAILIILVFMAPFLNGFTLRSLQRSLASYQDNATGDNTTHPFQRCLGNDISVHLFDVSVPTRGPPPSQPWGAALSLPVASFLPFVDAVPWIEALPINQGGEETTLMRRFLLHATSDCRADATNESSSVFPRLLLFPAEALRESVENVYASQTDGTYVVAASEEQNSSRYIVPRASIDYFQQYPHYLFHFKRDPTCNCREDRKCFERLATKVELCCRYHHAPYAPEKWPEAADPPGTLKNLYAVKLSMICLTIVLLVISIFGRFLSLAIVLLRYNDMNNEAVRHLIQRGERNLKELALPFMPK